jgi:hypothetical protein
MHFCDYLPFEENVVFDLYNFEFPSGWFVPSLIEIGRLILEKKIF